MKKVLSTYWKYSKGIRSLALITICAYIVGFLLRDILRPYLLKMVVDAMPKQDFSHIWTLVFIFAGVQVGMQFFFRFGDFMCSAFESRHMKILRNTALEHLMRHSLAFFSGTFTGSLVTKQKRFVHSAELLFDELIGQYIAVSVQIIGVIIVMYFVCPPIAVGVIIWTLLYFTNIILVSKKRMRLDVDEAKHDSKVTGAFADTIGNIPIVKMFGSRKREEKRFYGVTMKHYGVLMNSWNFSNRQNIVQGIFSTIVHVGSIGGGVYLLSQKQLTIGGLVLVTTYAGQLSGCLWDFGRSIKRCTKAFADAKEMVDIIEQTPDILDRPGAIDAPQLLPKEASVTFTDVSFIYPNGAHVLDGFSLQIPAGQKIAIIGPSGAGKTTLVKALLREADIQSGTIQIGDYNIAEDVTQDGLKSLVSCVAQNIDMFNRTLFENIAYGKEGASMKEVTLAAKRARIHEFIETLDKQYETRVGERGVKLSGGQRQRVAIARALLHDSPILILDEATSSLDNVKEQEIQSILENGLKDKTVIVIAHRLSTIRNCDRIIVMDDGVIAQDGNHETLIADASGIYYRMLNSHEFAVEMDIEEEEETMI